jgi:peptidoglycan/LPS O-acetylase OafA/YrhL
VLLVKSVAVASTDSFARSHDRYRSLRKAPLVRTAQPASRFPAFDHLRVLVIALVVLQHVALGYMEGGQAASGGAYTNGSAPVVDMAQWSGFNVVVTWTNGFFMPLMFLLSGLFVRPSLARKGLRQYLVDRGVRLGIPLLVGIVTIVPLSYYAAFLLSGGSDGFATFWKHMVTVGPWPSGPLWFVGALLLFDAALAMVLAQDRVWHFARRFGQGLDRIPAGAWLMLFIVASAVAYLPFHLAFGKSHWLTAGPFGIQSSRIGLYFFSFAAGAFIGPERLARAFERQWVRWPVLAVLATAAFFALDGRQVPAWVDAITLVLFSTITAFALLALAVRFTRESETVGQSLSANAYGIYLVHWPIVLWLQLLLLWTPLAPLAKAALALTLGFTLSWAASSLLRRLPGVARAV